MISPLLAGRARRLELGVLAAALVFATVGIGWGLPGSDTWAADSIAPRSCGLGAVAETYLPGHFHVYGPLHMAILQLLALPWLLATIARVGTDAAAIERAMIAPLPMTAIDATARLVSVAMFLGVVAGTMRLWTRLASRRAGIAAGVIVATNSTLVYYAHTGNLEVPYIFWSTWALVELDRVLAGEDRALRALALIIAAVVTKDQAAASFLFALPACALARPELLRAKSTWRAAAIATLGYLVVSGALPNPVGYARHVALIFGPASKTWASYPATWGGRLAEARDFVRSTPRYASWPALVAACFGVGCVIRSRRGVERTRALLPFLAAVSFTVFATFFGRRAEDRFSLPEAVFFFPYAAVALDALAARWTSRWQRRALVAACVVTVLLPLRAVASIDATLVGDARYEAERFLAALPEGTRVEVYGGPRFLPRLPPNVTATRVGSDDPAGRTPLPGLAELRARPLDVTARRPEYVVLSTEFSHPPSTAPTPMFGVTDYVDADSTRFFDELRREELGYARVLDAECRVPWPLRCRCIHGSTGEPIWIYRRRAE